MLLTACGVDEKDYQESTGAESQTLSHNSVEQTGALACTPYIISEYTPLCQDITVLLANADVHCAEMGMTRANHMFSTWCDTPSPTCQGYPVGYVCRFGYFCCE